MMQYLETGSLDPAYNLAFEEYVLRNCRSGSYLILWQNQNAVIIGKNQNTLEEIDREFVQRHGIRVVRRNTGGGAVYHDLGNLNYSFITDLTAQDHITDSRFAEIVVSALRELGCSAERTGRNDILISGQKVSGTAQQHLGERILYHGTLLFDSDPDMIAGALRPDPEKYRSKSVKSVRSRVGNIRSHLPQDMSLCEFWQTIKQALARDGLSTHRLDDAALSQIAQLKLEKYDSWEWNYGSSPGYSTQLRRRVDGGLLDIRLDIKRGVIENAAIYGDFLATQPIKLLTDALRGCPYRKADILRAVDQIPLSACLGGIRTEDFLSVILDTNA